MIRGLSRRFTHSKSAFVEISETEASTDTVSVSSLLMLEWSEPPV